MLRRPRPLEQPRGTLAESARSYVPALLAGAAIGVLLLAVLLVVEAYRDRDARGQVPVPAEIVLEPVDPVTGEVPLGEFGACVQERLTEVAPAGDETVDEMLAAQQACMPLLETGDTTGG